MQPKPPTKLSKYAEVCLQALSASGMGHKVSMGGTDSAIERARLAIETHLARIEQHRPLNQIVAESERQAAEKLRAWFKNVFLGVADNL
jgi:hypothetical protein